MSDILNASVAASAIRLATPYIFAGMGETMGQRSGVLNLGVDGIMLMGAFAAHYTVLKTGNLLLGIVAALVVGAVMGLSMAFISVTLQAEQGISGIGVYLFGLGLSDLLYQKLEKTPTLVKRIPRVDIPYLSDIPVIGEIFFNHNWLVYVAFMLVPICAFVLNRTTFGLQIRAVGQNPEAADAMGINVSLVRYITVTIGGLLAGIAGASLSIALSASFQGNLTAGKGFIVVALVYFGAWRPYWVLAGAMLFSCVNALVLQIETVQNSLDLNLVLFTLHIPSEFVKMSPYVATIIALVFASRRVEQPTALTKAFERGE